MALEKFINPFTAIVMGIGVGFVVTVQLQRILNEQVSKTCYGPADQIVSIRSAIGTTLYCQKGN